MDRRSLLTPGVPLYPTEHDCSPNDLTPEELRSGEYNRSPNGLTCAICDTQIDTGYGKSAYPVKNALCCDLCELEVVYPARMDPFRESKLLSSMSMRNAYEFCIDNHKMKQKLPCNKNTDHIMLRIGYKHCCAHYLPKTTVSTIKVPKINGKVTIQMCCQAIVNSLPNNHIICSHYYVERFDTMDGYTFDTFLGS
jgi:hypothetical protein